MMQNYGLDLKFMFRYSESFLKEYLKAKNNKENQKDQFGRDKYVFLTKKQRYYLESNQDLQIIYCKLMDYLIKEQA